MPAHLTRIFLIAALIGCFSTDALAQLRMSRLFADGMMVQRDAEVPVWGWARPGAEVEVRLDGDVYTTEAAPDSSWSITLPTMQAGGPHSMTIRSRRDEIEIDDIVVGDVWVASGQSNMEWTVVDSDNAEAEIAAAYDRMIRHFKVPTSWAEEPEETLAGGSWEPATPEYVGGFTAVGYFFARELRKHVDVPIGILHTSWGGSRIEPWMSAEALGLDENAFKQILADERAREERLRAQLRQKIGDELPLEDAGMRGGTAVWAAPDLDDSDWERIAVPRRWEEVGYDGMDGIGWYRTTFILTTEEAAQGVTVGLGMIDDSDDAYVNGHHVGGMDNAWNTARVYDVPAEAVREGVNTIAIRVEDTGGGGGVAGSADLLYVEIGDERRPLPEEWRFKVGQVSVNTSGQKNQVATLLYNKMIHPLLRFPIKGVIWYQGESNAYPDDALKYREQFKAMIEDWRARWNSGEFPFLWVQLANYMEPDAQPAESGWALLRESQSAALELPNTAQAVAIDVGEADDIHPRNKQDVGLRLALAARKIAYEREVVHSGPVFTAYRIDDGRFVLAFENVGLGLRARGGELGGFAIAGEDRKFVWANAEIDGDYVVVWSDEVERPVAVRYGWGNNPDRANLYNAEGLPASPFRTDRW